MGSKNDETRKRANTNRVSIENNRVGNIDMNIVATSDLNFQGKAMIPVSNITGTWLTSSDLANALEYSNSRAVTMIYNKYCDEFTSAMTQVLEVSTSGNYRKKVRIFSLRGAHLIAMFARTPVAKEFRRWVLDILDREVAYGNVPSDFDFHNAANAARSINHLLSEIKNIWRGGLEDALRLMEYKSRGDISDRLAYMTFITLPLEKALVKEDKKGRIH